MKDSITKFILLTLLATMPVAIYVAMYAARDPFHVVHPVGKDLNGRDSVMAGNNAGFLSVETYLAHNDERHYDSFIFGSSMSQNYKASVWQSHLDSTASILHFDASSETLTGIINKMRFLNSHGTVIKNAMIVIEAHMLSKKPNENDILYIQHPATSGAENWFRFHTLFFNAYRRLGLKTILGNNLNVLNEEAVDGHYANRIEPINEKYYGYIDSLIAHDPSKFFTAERLKSRSHSLNPKQLGYKVNSEVEELLVTIKHILDENKTNYIVIVPPCNAREHLHEHDLWEMKTIFGENKVHDFSGAPGYTLNERLYYDSSGHLISSECTKLLDSAYRVKPVSILNPFYTLP